MVTHQSVIDYSLQGFYRTYKHWLECGAPHKMPYSRTAGLCINVAVYVEYKMFDSVQKPSKLRDKVSTDAFVEYTSAWTTLDIEMREQFQLADLDRCYPFGGAECYNEEARTFSSHLNVMRRRWVWAMVDEESPIGFIDRHCRDLRSHNPEKIHDTRS